MLSHKFGYDFVIKMFFLNVKLNKLKQICTGIGDKWFCPELWNTYLLLDVLASELRGNPFNPGPNIELENETTNDLYLYLDTDIRCLY